MPNQPPHHCGQCGHPDARWSVTRQGDVVVEWACDPDLAAICESLQRGHEVTRLVVVDSRKALEWAEIHRALEEIADE